jgi:hypothetical protein
MLFILDETNSIDLRCFNETYDHISEKQCANSPLLFPLELFFWFIRYYFSVPFVLHAEEIPWKSMDYYFYRKELYSHQRLAPERQGQDE